MYSLFDYAFAQRYVYVVSEEMLRDLEKKNKEQELDRVNVTIHKMEQHREELERQLRLEQKQELERERREQEDREERELAARQQQEAERRREIAERASAEAAAEAARTEFELVQSATAIIQQAVQQVWNRPPSARNGMRAILQIQMLPTGELLDARITQSSGDPAFDRASENAVYSAAPFTELRDLPINIFNANFRTLSLIFQPEDLLN